MGMEGTKNYRFGSSSSFIHHLGLFWFFSRHFGRTAYHAGSYSRGSYSSNLWVPAPEWLAGLGLLVLHNQGGHLAFTAGEITVQDFCFFVRWLPLSRLPSLFNFSAARCYSCLAALK